MTVNKYDRAVEAPILNTYVPINFGELYKIGSAQKAAVDEAVSLLGTALKTFGEFQSLSEVDTKNYYNKTIGQMKDLVQAASQNPDLMKDAAFRSQLQSRINNLDYVGLSRLKQSAKNLETRKQYDRDLALKGLYNPEAHYVNYEGYDTLGSGLIFSDTNPLPYESVVDMVKPYVDNLQYKYLGTDQKTGLMAKGVTQEDIVNQLNENMSSIVNDPHFLLHLDILLRRGLDRDTAKKQLMNEIYLAGNEFTKNEVSYDPWWLQQKKSNLEYYLKHKGDELDKPVPLTDAIAGGGIEKYVNMYNSSFSSAVVHAYEKKYGEGSFKTDTERMKGTNKADAKAASDQINAMVKEVNKTFNSTKALRQVYEDANEISLLDGNTNEGMLNGSKAILEQLKQTMIAKDHNTYMLDIPGLSAEALTTDFGKMLTIESGNSGGLITEGSFIYNLCGFKKDKNSKEYTSFEKVDEALKSGKLGQLVPSGGNWVISVPTSNNREKNAQGLNILIRADVANKQGITDQDITNIGGIIGNTSQRVTTTDTSNSNITLNFKLKTENGQPVNVYDGDDYEFVTPENTKRNSKVKESNSKSKSATTSKTGGIKYYSIPVARFGANSGSGTNAEGVNQSRFLSQLTGKQAGDNLMEVQQTSYN